jgi:glycosyltransferase involved in cell wall biosynthesis
MNGIAPFLSVIIPAYNEESRISKTLVACYQYLTAQSYSWEILVVLDGPTDDTLGTVQSFAHGKENIRWIDRRENRGKGYTVREGMMAARGKVRLFMDADNSTDISHFDQMNPLFEQGHDVVICSRDSKDAGGAQQAVPQPFLKRFLGNAGNLFIQLMAVPGIWDTQCGFKAFSAEAAGRIFSVALIDQWGFDIEALALARRFGYEPVILPAHWIDDAETHVSIWNYVGTLAETLKVRWNLWSGAYNSKKSLTDAKDQPSLSDN